MAPSILVDYTEHKDLTKNSHRHSLQIMGKTKKFSKGYSSGFVSDYRHAVETVAESEGFGSSGRVDTERTTSEDSCVVKRKVISLNMDTCDGFGIPLQVLSVSKMSRSEKKELKLRLEADLDQVQALQKKFSMRFSNVVPASSSSDIRSCSDGQKRPALDRYTKFSDYLSGQVKRKVPPSQNSNSMKRNFSGPVKQAAPVISPYTNLLKQCETLLKRLMSHQFGWVFNEPVDVVKLNIPDYFTVIKHPMDFGTIMKKITTGKYFSPREFSADVRLTLSNAMAYNPPENNFHLMAVTVSKFFEQRWKSIEKKLPPDDSASVPPKRGIPRESESVRQTLPSKKRKISSTDYEVKPQPIKIMTNQEKNRLAADIEAWNHELPEDIINLLKGNTNSNEDEIEIEVDSLSDDTLFTVRKLLDDHLRNKQAKKRNAEPCEMEILNESGLSNSSMQPCRGNDPVDEDVDIGGNDLPISSYPPVEIEKDTAHRTSKCSSSSSSSSDSGSSSSDSDTGSSSDSDSDGGKASPRVNTAKETEQALPQKGRNHGDQHDGNQSVSGLDQLEQSSQPKPASVEADSRQEGESAPPDRQVSPDKLYRVALMKNRFADTILKAHEKTFDKGDKGDPEKLRREREELERIQREEKARLQAEAKAAEAARKQAEAEAAAEAKRTRELEREAARLALQKMEKTVDINENCHFLEDLEMLRSAPAPHLPSTDEMSPYHSPNGIDGFKLQGSNPLEQLGLFMKVDDDEEEEVDLGNVPAEQANDVEEGVID